MQATNTNPPGRESDKFMLRFPDGMREQISEQAKAKGRSMNAEIVARLQSSLDFPQAEELPLVGDGLVVYLLLDTNSKPISWDEIRHLYSDITNKQPVRTLQVSVIAPDIKSSSEREAKALKLAEKLRSRGNSRVLLVNLPSKQSEDL